MIRQIGPKKKKKTTNNSNFENESERAEKFNDLFVKVGARKFEKTQNYLKATQPRHDMIPRGGALTANTFSELSPAMLLILCVI